MSAAPAKSRLSMGRAAFVVARRDFTAILFSRVFFFFLLGPLFPLIVGALAGGIGNSLSASAGEPEVGIALSAEENARFAAAYRALQPQLGTGVLPRIRPLADVPPGETFDARGLLERREGNIAAVVTGTLDQPVLTAAGPMGRLRADVALIAATARGSAPTAYPPVVTETVATSGASDKRARIATAQAGQTLLFLLIMLLAGMVLSNLVEEKANKIIEILAAAIPMDAVFMGKLFAMLGVSLVGLSVWGAVIAGMVAMADMQGPLGFFDPAQLPDPGVGWPMFFVLGVAYFSMGYLLLGSLFLAIGSLATTVREVQTLSMPVTMAQVLLFFFASYAMARPGEPIEVLAIAFPLSSPFAMLARAALSEGIGVHLLALGWQALWVLIAVRFGAMLFRRRVLKSGAQARRSWLRALFPKSKARARA
jgi:ABC-2 type transport system permease protein